jgi:hypothetical protein
VAQQLGGTLGVAVLVTVFGSAVKHVTPLAHATALEQANHVFVRAADQAFMVGTLFVIAAIVLVALTIRSPRKDAVVEPELALAE